MTQLICGVNDCSRWLDASLGSDGAHARFPNTAEGIAELAVFCHTHAVTLVAMEATGGYERQAFALLIGNGLPVAILNPRSVRQFASGMGRLEKTDRIDAGMIAWFAAVTKAFGRPSCPPPASSSCARSSRGCASSPTSAAHSAYQQRLLTNPRVEASFAELLALVAGKPDALAQSIVASVVRHHELDFAAFAQRLADAGKPLTVVRIALAHKLLIRLNAKARQTR